MCPACGSSSSCHGVQSDPARCGLEAMRIAGRRSTPVCPNHHHRVDAVVELHSTRLHKRRPRRPTCRVEQVADPGDVFDVGPGTRFRVSVDVEEPHRAGPSGAHSGRPPAPSLDEGDDVGSRLQPSDGSGHPLPQRGPARRRRSAWPPRSRSRSTWSADPPARSPFRPVMRSTRAAGPRRRSRASALARDSSAGMPQHAEGVTWRPKWVIVGTDHRGTGASDGVVQSLEPDHASHGDSVRPATGRRRP